MNNHSKAIAAFISSLFGVLVSFGLIEPSTAEILGENLSMIFSSLLVVIATTLAVYQSPKNEE